LSPRPALVSAPVAASPGAPQAARDQHRAIGPADILALQATVCAHANFRVAASAFAEELASLLQAQRAAIGFIRRSQSRVMALSHATHFNAGAEHLAMTAAAMDEAIEQEASIAWPQPAGSRPLITAAHAALGRRDGTSIATIPLVVRARAVGALALMRPLSAPFGMQEIAQCERVAQALGPVLQLKLDAERSWAGRLMERMRSALQMLHEPGRPAVKAGAGIALIMLALAAFVPVDYRIGAPARVEGAIQRALVAPADGFLRELHVRPGDHVKSGQVLAELAQDDLRLEQQKWGSELSQHENNAAAALARADRAQFVVNQARADEARAQLDLASRQLERTRITAPFDGVVIAGDLTQNLGAPLQRGETLLTLAPEQQFRLLIEVDERDISDVIPGAAGHLALGALIGRSLPFEVVRVTPMASARDGRNFFEVEGKFEGTPQGLRPGLQGVAKTEAGSRTLAWIWTHRFVDWLRLAAWSWGL